MAEAGGNLILSDEPDAAQASNSTPSKPLLEFRLIFNKQALDEFQQDAIFQVQPPNISDLSYLLLARVHKVRPMLHASLAENKRFVFWLAMQVVYPQATNELVDDSQISQHREAYALPQQGYTGHVG